MRDYTLLIEDDRYSVPTLLLVIAAGEERARELALTQLENSPHHIAVEILAGDMRVARIARTRSTHLGN